MIRYFPSRRWFAACGHRLRPVAVGILALAGTGCDRSRPDSAEPPGVDASPPVVESASIDSPASGGGSPPPGGEPGASPDWAVHLVDATDRSGIDFVHTDGGSGRYYIVESVTGGVALFDYDQDGLLDIYFLNGAPLPGAASTETPSNRLFRNLGDWKFQDVTDSSGVGDIGFGLGVCVGDYDHDGFPDLYVNNYGRNVLYRNRGDGTFHDATAGAGVDDGERVGAGVCFFDADGDGLLDLYVAHYVQFAIEEHRVHSLRGRPSYPGPLHYLPEPDSLYRNLGDGRFEDISESSGVAAHAGTGMGVVCCDLDGDGHLDVFVGNDQMPNFLFRNDGGGRFEEVGLAAGLAVDAGGHVQATMGVDVADFEGDGRIGLHVTSFAEEFATLYRSVGGGLFADVTTASGAGQGTYPHVTWGNAFGDLDNDGFVDLFVACGHLDPHAKGVGETTAYEAENVVLKGEQGRFRDVSAASGPGLRIAKSSRGLALGDLDNDGDLDVVILNSRMPPTILENRLPRGRGWLAVRLVGTRSNRDAIGATVTITTGDLTQTRRVLSGRGYQSHFGSPLHFGLGQGRTVDQIDVRWPDGRRQRIPVSLSSGEILLVEPGQENHRSPEDPGE